MKKGFLFWVGVILLPIFAAAQKTEIRFFTVSDGLPSNATYGIVQDSQGFIWVNTGSKLCRYDGEKFLSHLNSSHPVFAESREPVSKILTLGANLAFVVKQKLHLFNTSTGTETTNDLAPNLPSGLSSNGFCFMVGKGAFVVSFNDEQSGQVHIFLWKDGKIIRQFFVKGVNAVSANFFSTIGSDQKGHVYFVSSDLNSVLKIDANGRKVGELAMPVRATFRDIIRLVPGSNGSVWLCVNSRIFKLDIGVSQFRVHPVSRWLQKEAVPVYDLAETITGDLWLCAPGNHLYFYESGQDAMFDYREQLMEIVESNVTLSQVFLDNSGSVWVNCDLGLLKVTRQEKFFNHFFAEANPICHGICSFRGFAENEQGDVYASFYNNIFKIEKGKIPDFSPVLPIESGPFDLFFHDKKLLLNAGLIFDLSQRRLLNRFHFNAPLSDNGVFAADGNGQIWLAYYHLLFQLDESTNPPRWKQMGVIPGQGYAADLVFDPHNRSLWYGSNNELVAIDPLTLVQKRYGEGMPDLVAQLKCIYPDGKGRLWLGTEKGLVFYDYQAEKWRRYTQGDGLPNDIVVGILPEGDSCLWISTFNGLSRLHIENGRFLNFYKKDGLADNEFNRASFFKASDGQMFFGGVKGVTAFYPNQVMEKYRRSATGERLLLRSVTMTKDGSDTLITRVFHDETDRLDVYHVNRTVRIEFGVLSAGESDATFYSYVLEGLDQAWSAPSKSSTVTYSSLPSGKYVFRVKALDARGQWLKEEISLRLRVHAAWWTTWWAYTIYVLAGLLLAVGIAAYLRTSRDKTLIARQKAQLEQSLAEKEAMLKEIHHRVKNNLQIISGLLERQALKTTDELTKKLMKEGQDRVFSMALVHQNLYQSDNFSAINIRAYLESLTKNIEKTHATPDKKIVVTLDVDDATLDIDAAIPVALILNELITNCYKYAFAGRSQGHIAVDFHQRQQDFFLKVRDDGVGLGDHLDLQNTKTLGLSLVRGLTRQLDGKLHFASSEQGAEFEVRFLRG